MVVERFDLMDEAAAAPPLAGVGGVRGEAVAVDKQRVLVLDQLHVTGRAAAEARLRANAVPAVHDASDGSGATHQARHHHVDVLVAAVAGPSPRS